MKMKKTPTLRRLMALLLFLLLLGSLAPAVCAAEEGSVSDEATQSAVDPPDNNQPNEEDGDDLPEGTPNSAEPDSNADSVGLFSNAGRGQYEKAEKMLSGVFLLCGFIEYQIKNWKKYAAHRA